MKKAGNYQKIMSHPKVPGMGKVTHHEGGVKVTKMPPRSGMSNKVVRIKKGDK